MRPKGILWLLCMAGLLGILLGPAGLAPVTQGAQLPITLGTAPNDGSGQTLRSAMGNAQTNFTELYGLTGSGSPFVLMRNGWSTNQSLTNAVFGGAGLRPAFSVMDSSAVYFTNVNALFTKNSTLSLGDGSGSATLSVDDLSYISDSAFSKRWNFKVSPTVETVARFGDFTNANTVYLTANGNDATAIRGNAAFPFSTYTNAVEACRDNDTLLIFGGRYFAYSAFQGYVDNTTTRRAAANLIGKTNVTIQGIGNPTIWYTNQCDVLDIFACTNITVRDLTMECTIRLPGSGFTNTSATIEMRGNSAGCKFINVVMLNPPNHGITGAFSAVTNCLVDGCRFYNGGYSNAVPSLGKDGAMIVPCAYWTIRNCEFDYCFRAVEFIYGALSTYPLRNITMSGCHIRHSYADAPIWGQNSVSGTDGLIDIDIYDNTIVDCLNIGSVYPGIDFGGGSIRLKIHDNRIIDPTLANLNQCIAVSSFGNNNVDGCEISDNYTEGGNGQGILLWDQGTLGIVTNSIVARNKIRSVVGQGIAVSARDTKIIHNDILACTVAGIYLWDNSSGGGQRNSVVNNEIAIRGAGAPSGIKLDAGSTNEVLLFNRISGYASQAILDAALPGHNFEAQNWVTNGFFYGTNDLISTRIGFYNPYKGTNAGTFDVTGTLTGYGGLIIGPSGSIITNVLTGRANLNFPSTSAQSSSDLVITVTGATTNDVATVSAPPVTQLPNSTFSAFASNNAVWVRFNNYSSGALDPGPAVFSVKVDKY